jgi:hypothetical protein
MTNLAELVRDSRPTRPDARRRTRGGRAARVHVAP